jgi:predicted glycosyltransferase involved in capsule biosynthesis
MIDIDSIVPPLFLKSIEDFYAKPENANIKLAHRVRFIDEKTNQSVKNGFDEEFIKRKIIANAGYYKLAKERFTVEERDAIGEEDYQKNALGNSHFTAKKEFWFAIGGCDERFKGRTCEDLDFNLRLFKYMNNGCLRKNPELSIYHVLHMHEKDWSTQEYSDKNRKLYAENKEKNIINVPMNEDWGYFPE